MGFIQNIFKHQQKKVQEKNNACAELISRIDDALRDAKSIFSAPQAFIDPAAEAAWKNRNSTVLADSETHKIQRLKRRLNTRYWLINNSICSMRLARWHSRFNNITSVLQA